MAGRKRTGAEDAFMTWALRKIIAQGSAHPLAFLIDWTKQNWISRYGSRRKGSSEHAPGVQPGHLTSFHAGEPERLALEDADFNQEKNYQVETRWRGGIVKTTALTIGGIPVESATAEMWERVGFLVPKGIVKSAKPHLGWAKDDPDGNG
jgi:hypothetical protein